MIIKRNFEIIKDGKQIVLCDSLSEAVAECRFRGYLSTEGYKIIKWELDDVYCHGWNPTVYNVYGEVKDV